MSQENETLDEKKETLDESNSTKTKEADLLKEIFTKNEKIRLMSEALGLEKGFSIDELSKSLEEKNKQKKIESEQLENERREKMTKNELLEEQVKELKSQFNSILDEKKRVEERAKIEQRKSQLQEALLKEGVIESKISTVTKMAMIEDDGTDPFEFVRNVFKNNNLDLFKSGVNNGANTGNPNNPPEPKQWTGKFSGRLGDLGKK